MMPQPVDISQSTERPQPIDPSHSPIDSHIVSPSRITDGKRSKYIGRACQDCQRRKVKCSGEQVCRNCRERQQECIYMPHTRRGRKQGTKRGPSIESDCQTRSEKKQRSKEESAARLSGGSPLERAFIPFHKPSLPIPLSEMQSPCDSDDEADAYDIQESRPRSVSLSSQLLSIRDIVHPDKKEQENPTLARKALRNKIFPVELPRPAILWELLDIYFRDLDSFFPFIERSTTNAEIQKTLHCLGHSDNQLIVDVKSGQYSTIALLCNMLAIAECFCVSGSCSHEIRPGWSLFLRGAKLIQHCLSRKHIDLHLIQYHALSSEYLMQSELLHDASQAISNAAQLAMRARLNEEKLWDSPLEKERQTRKRLWWTIYFLDRKISQRTGSPYGIRDNEVAVSEFSDPSTTRTDRYMQVLIDLGKLWSLIWDTFFAAAAPKPQDWKEVEIMDTRILIVQRGLASELVWETENLERVYLAQSEPESHIRRRLALYIRLNLLRLTIRQNPIQKRQNTKCHKACVSLASQTVTAIAAFTDNFPSILPCGFMFSTALLECIYHLILVMRAAPSDQEHAVSMKSFQLAYQLLDQFSQVLYTAKRALRALNSVVSLAAVTNSENMPERPSPCSETVQDCSIDLSFCTANNMDFFDPMSWQLDDIPLDVVALVSNMGNDGSDFPNGLSEQSLDSDFCLWNSENGGDEIEQFDITL